MTVTDKVGVLADAAKYDASCSTAGSARQNTPGGIGNGAVGGICHAWSSDGRCVALLKVLLSNACAWDCAYCVNRRSNDIRRAAFEPEELVRLIVDFYKRNYIEGAFLSSGVTGCPDITMERLVFVAKTLRTRERFNGYIHLKVIPGACDALVMEAARWADRVSVNIELPSAESLARVAPDKTPRAILGPMRTLARASGFEPRKLLVAAGAATAGCPSYPVKAIGQFGTPGTEGRDSGRRTVAEPQPLYETHEMSAGHFPSVRDARKTRFRNPEGSILPAGQTTQLVIGASPESDAAILILAENLYLAYDVRRVYYSAFIPNVPDPRLPAASRPPLSREHRLYQADWLFRFYGFSAAEILDPAKPFLDPDLDPKSDWALHNLHLFPAEINKAEYSQLIRIPGIGPKSASRILRARRKATLRPENLVSLGVVMKRAHWFITCAGKMSCLPAVPDRDWGLNHDHRHGEPVVESCSPASMLDRPASLRALLIDPVFIGKSRLQLEFGWEGSA